jgi:hypothetical protein
MPATYESIATTTLGTAAASVTFSSIPATFTDLVLVINGTTNSNSDISFNFNGDTGSNYSRTFLYGSGSSAISGGESNQVVLRLDFKTTTQGTAITQFNNYSNTTTNKTIIGRYGDSNLGTIGIVGLWRDTAAINSISMNCTPNTFSSGSTFTLYGIKAA